MKKNIVVSIYGYRYDRLKENASASRRKFVDSVRNLFADASVSFIFFTEVEVDLAGREDFLIEIRVLQAELDWSDQIAVDVAGFAAKSFSYSDCDNHDSWDCQRTAFCYVDQSKKVNFTTTQHRR